MKILIDERIRNVEYKYLSEELELEVTKLPLSNQVYEEISGHSDIFYTNIDDKVICSPNAEIKEAKFIIGTERVGEKYPQDVKYNICQIGENIIGSKYADLSLKNKINILVNQGYVKCSIAVTGKNSCITSDEGIYKALKEHNIDVCVIKEKNIKLLKKDKTFSNMQGFIGGASAIINDTFVLFGDIKSLSTDTQEKIKEHLKKHNLQLKIFENLPVIDYGGIIMYK